MRGLDGDPDVFECTYVDSNVSHCHTAALTSVIHAPSLQPPALGIVPFSQSRCVSPPFPSPLPPALPLLASPQLTDLPFFASRVKLGKNGVEAVLPNELQGLSPAEQAGLEGLKEELKASIDKGVAFANKDKQPVAA